MNRIKFSVLYFLLLFLFIATNDIHAQVTIGSGEEPNAGSLLDLNEGIKGSNGENSKKGLQLPRVELFHLKRLKMGEFEITDTNEKLAHAGLVVFHIPPATKSNLKPISEETMSDTSIRQNITAGVYYWDGEKWGKVSGDEEAIKPTIELSVTPQQITFDANDTDIRYYTVTVNEGTSWMVNPITNPDWTITPSPTEGKIAINPKTSNTDITTERTINLTVTATKEGAENAVANISAIQGTPFSLEVTPSMYTFEANDLTPQTFNVSLTKGVAWTIDTHKDWTITPARGTGSGSFTVVPQTVNSSSSDKVFTPTIRAERNSETKMVQITLAQKGMDYNADLSLPNCYIVSKADTRFTIPIKKAIAVWKSGVWQTKDTNGALYSLLPESKDVDQIENLTARVLWYDNKDVVTNIAIEGTGADRNMILNVSGTEGNAVVALYDDNNNILWSWHIWATDQPAEQRFSLMNSNIWMDRNLGATETTTASNGSSYKHKGLLYQWGRKDPFPGSNSTTSTSRVPIYVWNGSGYTTVSSNYPTKAVADFGATIDAPGQRLNHTIKNPLDFMTTTATDWYFLYKLIGGDKTRFWSDRWGDVPSSSTSIGPKSVMDPCPEGWRVPYPTGSGLVQYSPWGETFNGSQTACTALTYGGNQYGFSYKEGSSTTQVYYPSTGQLNKETGQMQVDTGSESGSGNPRVVSPFTGTYWNSGGTIVGLGAMGEFKGNTLFIANPLKSSTTGSGSSDGQFTEFRAVGAAVRCIKDTYDYNK